MKVFHKGLLALFCIMALLLSQTVMPGALANQSGGALYGLAIDNLATRSGPSTKYDETGTYFVKGQYIQIISRAYDSLNEIWWVKCVIPENGRQLWTGYKRFDSATLQLESIPIEGSSAPAYPAVTKAPVFNYPQGVLYGLAIDNLATRSGPSTKYDETGTYFVKGQYIQIISRAYDSSNEIWWVKCVIPENGRQLWTGYKRFDSATLPLESIPIEGSSAPAYPAVTQAPVLNYPQGVLYGLAIDNLATRSGPSTKYDETGTYFVKGQYIQIISRAYDTSNEIWWVKCVIPENGRLLWTGYKRFDSATLPLEWIPVEGMPQPQLPIAPMPTFVPVPSRVPIPTNMPVDDDWFGAYWRFVIDRGYLQSGQQYYQGNWHEPLFSLYDIDGDGTPELIIYNGRDYDELSTCYVYTFDGSAILYIGNVGSYDCELYSVNARGCHGLLAINGVEGRFTAVYYQKHGNSLTSQVVCAISYIDGEAPDITPYTDNESLLAIIRDYEYEWLTLLDYEYIAEFGWERFVDEVLMSTEEVQPPSDGEYIECDYSCRKSVYTAGEAVVFDLFIYDGRAPYTVEWSIYEDSYEALGEACVLKKYWEEHGDADTSGSLTTNDTHVSVSYTPPVQGEDPLCIRFMVKDADGRVNDYSMAVATVAGK